MYMFFFGYNLEEGVFMGCGLKNGGLRLCLLFPFSKMVLWVAERCRMDYGVVFLVFVPGYCFQLVYCYVWINEHESMISCLALVTGF